jgi:hypothetical protein
MTVDHPNRSAGSSRGRAGTPGWRGVPSVVSCSPTGRRAHRRTARPAPRRRSAPTFESLEPRIVLSATHTESVAAPLASVATVQANRAYLDGLIGTDLNSSGGQALALKLTAELDRGVPRATVVLHLLQSEISRVNEVDVTYEELLGNTPTRSRLRAGLALVGRDGDTRPLEDAIIGSREYLKVRGQGTATGFLTAMYQDILGRAPSSSELAAGRAAMVGHTARVGLATALMNTKAARTLLIQDEQAWFGATVPEATARELLSRPGGLVRLQADLLASDASYQRIVSPSPSLSAPETATPQLPGYPVAPGFDLTSSVQPLGLSSSYVGEKVFSIGAGTDDVPWIGTNGGLNTYNLNTGAMTEMTSTPAPVISIAAIDMNEAYAVYGATGGENSIIHVSNGEVTTLPVLPNGDYPMQVSADPDGDVWVLAESGNLFSLTGTGTWSPISTDGYSIKEVAVGSESNIWALTTSGEGLTWTLAGGFQPNSFLTSGYTAIQATSDGAVWAYQAGYVVMKPSYGSFELLPSAAQPPQGLVLTGFVAGSMNRAFAFGYTTNNNQDDFQIDLMQIGIVDRQPIPFPTFTGDEQTAYLDLSASVTPNPAGVRVLYDTPGINWGTVEAALDATPIPANFPSDSAWQAVRSQLDQEINDVSQVYGRIDEIEQLDTQIQVINDGELNAVGQVEGLVDNNGNVNTTIRFVLEDLFEAVAGAVSDIGLSPVGATIASLLASGFSDGISYYESQNNDVPNQQVAIAYSQLQASLDSIYMQSIGGLNTDISKIVGDYGMLTTVAGAILDGQWPLDNTALPKVTEALTTTYEHYFYQTLTAANWQVVYLLNYTGFLTCPITEIISNVPTYDIFTVQVGSDSEDVYVMNLLGSTTEFDSNTGDHVPTSTLIADLANLGATTDYNFWTGAGGWSVILHVPASNS